jgi:hypothetical protein
VREAVEGGVGLRVIEMASGRRPEDDAERAVDFEAGEPGDEARFGVVGQEPVGL